MGEKDIQSTPWHFSDITQNLLLPTHILSRPHAVAVHHHIQHSCSLHAHHDTQSKQLQWRGKSGRKKATRRWSAGGGAHRKRSSSVVCVLSVATAVSGSEERKSHRGELSGSAGKVQRSKTSSARTKIVPRNYCKCSIKRKLFSSCVYSKITISHCYWFIFIIQTF